MSTIIKTGWLSKMVWYTDHLSHFWVTALVVAKKDTMGMFAGECLQDSMGKNALYDSMNREDLNWRKYHEQVARKTIHNI